MFGFRANSLLASLFLLSSLASARSQEPFRPPAVPLVTSDPYLSIWSEADHLTDDVTRHWTRAPHPLISLIRIDGKTFRLMGNEPKGVPALPQTDLIVLPTSTVYIFRGSGVGVVLAFSTPAIPSDLDLVSRPVTYLTWSVMSAKGIRHSVQLYDSVGSELSVNTPDQAVDWKREQFGPLTALSVGSHDQTLLRPAGDDTRIDWGYAYLAAPSDQTTSAIGDTGSLQTEFISNGRLDGKLDGGMPRPVKNGDPALGLAFDLGRVGTDPVMRTALVAYDEVYSIDYFGRKLTPYWRRNGATPATLLRTAYRDRDQAFKKADAFDRELTDDATALGGPGYAQILALAYRECLAAVGIAADSNGKPLLFTKENTSNGDIATVDVIFPMDPIWVLLSPTLAKASLVSNFDYAASPHWKFPNAPHDLGTYPQVFGRDDGGEGMPVEESGNMIILADAIAHDDGNADFASHWWPQLTQWAHYLEQYGLDPEDQLCTDDFMGHLAHNANLSVKAILALAAYGDMAKMRGDAATAERYMDMARADARHWVEVADAGDRSLLAFDKPGTWSQKYNLVWDSILGLNVFPPEVARKEIAYYKTQLQPYGLPLDSRTHLTKTDWSIWSATMAEDPRDFQLIIDRIYRYLNETTARDPIADSYMTDDPSSSGMHARPVVGGFFIKMLSDPAVWKKWSSRDQAHVSGWAPLPAPPKIQEVVPTGRNSKVAWRYTTTKPRGPWVNPGFDDSSWSQGDAGFGTEGTPSVAVKTRWDTGDIWIRRTFVMPNVDRSHLKLVLFHDEDVEIYVNGVLAASEPGYVSSYETLDIGPDAMRLLRPGATITLAAHCHQTTGGQGVDIGFAEVK